MIENLQSESTQLKQTSNIHKDLFITPGAITARAKSYGSDKATQMRMRVWVFAVCHCDKVYLSRIAHFITTNGLGVKR